MRYPKSAPIGATIALAFFYLLFGAGKTAAQANLVITDVSPNKTPIQAGDRIIFTVIYENLGDMAFEAGTPIKISVRLASEGAEVSCERTVLLEGEIPGNSPRVFDDCFIDFTEAGNYALTAAINGNQYEGDSLTVSEGESALPDEFGRLFTGLGMFAAMMAILAVGTEVTIDSIRVLLGMKRKVTAMEAFKKLEDQLPGKLAELGVSAPELKEFQSQVEEMRKTIKPVSDLASARQKIGEGQFGEAIFGVLREKLSDSAGQMLIELVDQHVPEENRQNVIATIRRILSETQEKTPQEILVDLQKQLAASDLPKQTFAPLLAQIESETQSLTDQMLADVKAGIGEIKDQIIITVYEVFGNIIDSLGLPSKLKDDLRTPLTEAVNGIGDQFIINLDYDMIVEGITKLIHVQGQLINVEWLEQQADTFLLKGKTRVMQSFDNDVRALLSQFGLSDATLDGTRLKLDQTLRYLSTKAEVATSAYVEGLKNLLSAVEERRNEVQSPFRKTWRAIRGGSFSLWVTVAVLFGLWGILFWWFLQAAPWFKLLLSLVISVLGVVIGAWILRRMESDINQSLPLDKDPGSGIIHNDARFLKKAAENEAIPLQTRRRARALLTLAESQNPQAAMAEVGATMSSLHSWLMKFQDVTSTGEYALEALQGHSRCILLNFSIGDFFSIPETVLNFLLRRENEMGKLAQEIRDKLDNLDKTKIAAILQERDDKHRDEEASRLRWLRVISAIIGIILAYFVNVDAAALLDKAIPGVADVINANIEIFNPNRLWAGLPDRVITPGIILAGLAASAGSAFWHDQLDRLQATKKSAEAAAKLLQSAQTE